MKIMPYCQKLCVGYNIKVTLYILEPLELKRWFALLVLMTA